MLEGEVSLLMKIVIQGGCFLPDALPRVIILLRSSTIAMDVLKVLNTSTKGAPDITSLNQNLRDLKEEGILPIC